MADTTITALDTAVSIDPVTDWLAIDQSVETNKINRNTLLGITGSPVGTTDLQTLTNKTLTGPTVSSPVLSGTVTGTYTLGGTPTFPATIVTTTGSQTLTNKTITAPAITGGSITNSTISVDAIAEYTVANGVTVDGLNIKDGKLNTNNSVIASNITAGAITPDKLVSGTGTGWPWTTFTPSYTNFSLGNGTLNYAKYAQIGKTLFVTFRAVLGSTSSVTGNITVSGFPTISSSYTAHSSLSQNAIFRDVSAPSSVLGQVQYSSTTAVSMSYISSATSNAAIAGTSATAPFTWADGDILSFAFIAEAA